VQSWSYLIYSLLQVQSIAIILEEAAAMVQAMVRPLVRAIRVRRLVLEHRDRALRVHLVGINVSALERFDNDTVVTVETLLESGIVKNPRDGVKILGNGELTKKLTVKVNAFSESAKSKIEALGGTCEVI
jgi:ribosomal protein L15